jgi:hypothetical protein
MGIIALTMRVGEGERFSTFSFSPPQGKSSDLWSELFPHTRQHRLSCVLFACLYL